MIEIAGFELREAFHLLFLKHLASRLGNRPYAVKGGVCLRLFHGSPRLSEDIDLDIVGISVETTRNHVETIFESRAFQSMLHSAGIERARARKSKMTETTQRWKVALESGRGGSYPSRVEFSRRKKDPLRAEPGVPDGAILKAHNLIPFVVSHYGGEEMAIQKVTALSATRRFACRDLFDLFHLLDQRGIDPKRIARDTKDLLGPAKEKIQGFSLPDFRGEVAPFLPEDLAHLYGSREGFEKMRRKVLALLP